MPQERGRSEDDFEAAGGIAWEVRVKSRASSGRGDRKIGDDDVDDQFQERLPKERSA